MLRSEDKFASAQGDGLWLIDWKSLGFSRCSIYVIAPEGHWPCKIGIAIAPRKRLAQLQTSHWKELKVAKCWWAENVTAARAVEKKAHQMLKEDKAYLLGEWFDRTPEKTSAVVEFAAMSLGIEISDTASEPKVRAWLEKIVSDNLDGHHAFRVEHYDEAVSGHARGYRLEEDWAVTESPEERWAAAPTPLTLRGKRGSSVTDPL